MPPLPQLGKYTLIEPLGSGATADVYRARDEQLGRNVALKVLKPALVADSAAFARFTQEAQAAAGLFHPHIATVLDMGESNGRFFIALRYIPGRSLDQILRQHGPLSWAETLRLAQQIGAALDFAHHEGFLHRDVKPSNILRGENGDFVLTDFGLARAMMGAGLTTHTGAALGTPAYIAPEIWRGEPASPSTDQYALACVIAETLSGQPLFRGETPPAVMTAHVLRAPELPAQWPPETPASLPAVLSRALAKEPAERFAAIPAFVAALSQPAPQADGEPAGADRGTPHPPEGAPPDRSGAPPLQPRKIASGCWWAAAGAGLLSLLVIGYILLIAAGLLPDPRTPPTVLPTETALAGEISLSPTDTPPPQAVLPTPAPGSETISAQNAARLTELNRLGEGGFFHLVWSPDGQTIAVMSLGEALLLDAQSMTVIERFASDNPVPPVAFSPDGSLFAIGMGQGQVLIFDTADWSIRTQFTADERPVISLVFTAGNRLATLGEEAANVRVWEATGSFVQTIAPQAAPCTGVAAHPNDDILAVSCASTVQLYEVEQGAQVASLTFPDASGVFGMTFSADGQLFAVSDANGEVQIWDANLWGLRCKTFMDIGMAADLSFDPAGRYLAGDSGDETARVWSAQDCSLAKKLPGEPASSVEFSPDGQWLAANPGHSSIQLYATADWQPRGALTSLVRGDALLSPGGQRLVQFDRATMQLESLSLPEGVQFQQTAVFTDQLWLSAVSIYGDYAALITYQQDLLALPLDDSQPRYPGIYLGAAREDFSPAPPVFSPDGSLLAAPDWAGDACVWRAGSDLALYCLGETALHRLAFSPDGSLLAVGSLSGEARIHHAEDGGLLETLADDGVVYHPVFSPDGSLLATTGKDNSILIWKLGSGAPPQRLTGHEGWIVDFQFSPDGRLLASKSGDNTIRVWQLADGREIFSIAHESFPFYAFSPDSRLLAVAGADFDGHLQLWDAAAGQLLFTSPGPFNTEELRFSPDGQYLYTRSPGALRVWGVAP